MSRQVSLSGDELIVVYSYTLYNVLANVAEQLSIPLSYVVNWIGTSLLFRIIVYVYNVPVLYVLFFFCIQVKTASCLAVEVGVVV